jgi:predicted alpha/beta superfamily hydrolase
MPIFQAGFRTGIDTADFTMTGHMNNCIAGSASRFARTVKSAGWWAAIFASAAVLAACGHGTHVAKTDAPSQTGVSDKTAAARPDAFGAPLAVTLPGAYEFAMQSAQGKDYKIFVAVPDGKPPADGFPVLYLLDGNAYFIAAASAMKEQSTFAAISGIQPLIVVGVGYPGQYSLNRERRSFDFLPPANGSGTGQFAALGASPGGADAFLDFLVGELRPALAARYPIDLSRQSLAGHSLGGYFALHALLHRPAAFNSYAAISPSIWWDDARLLKEARAQSPSLTNAKPAVDLLLAVSPLEMSAHPDRSAMMLSGARAMQTILATASQGLRMQYQELPGENHISTNLAAMSAILRQASGKPAKR